MFSTGTRNTSALHKSAHLDLASSCLGHFPRLWHKSGTGCLGRQRREKWHPVPDLCQTWYKHAMLAVFLDAAGRNFKRASCTGVGQAKR